MILRLVGWIVLLLGMCVTYTRKTDVPDDIGYYKPQCKCISLGRNVNYIVRVYSGEFITKVIRF